MKPGVAAAALAAGASIVNDVGASHRTSDVASGGRVRGGLRLHAHAGPAGHDAGAVRLCGCGGAKSDRSSGTMRRLQALRGRAGTGHAGRGNRVWEDRRAQFAVARGAAEIYKVRSVLCCSAFRASPSSASCWGEVGGRLAGSLACACWAVRPGCRLIRAHDVRGNRAGGANDRGDFGTEARQAWLDFIPADWRPALEILILTVGIYSALRFHPRHARRAGGDGFHGAAGPLSLVTVLLELTVLIALLGAAAVYPRAGRARPVPAGAAPDAGASWATCPCSPPPMSSGRTSR